MICRRERGGARLPINAQSQRRKEVNDVNCPDCGTKCLPSDRYNKEGKNDSFFIRYDCPTCLNRYEKEVKIEPKPEPAVFIC